MLKGTFLVVLTCCLYGAVLSRGIGTLISQLKENQDGAKGALDRIVPRMLSRIQMFEDHEPDESDRQADNSWFTHPIVRGGRSSAAQAFVISPWDLMYYRGKKAAGPLVDLDGGRASKLLAGWVLPRMMREDKAQGDVVLPWEMKYFSPMLRGKKSAEENEDDDQ